MRRKEAVEVTSGNVYQELGISDAAEMRIKAELMICIQRIMEQNGWSQRQAAKKMGVSQPKLCNLLKGQFHGISSMKLLDYLAKLGSEIRIVVNTPDKAEDCIPREIELEVA